MLTSSVRAHIQNRPSSKNITVQTTVGHLMARGLANGTTGEGDEGPIILFSKHGKEGTCTCSYILQVLILHLSIASLLDISVNLNPVNSQVNQRLQLQLLPIQIIYHAVCTRVVWPACYGSCCALGHSGCHYCHVCAVKGHSTTEVSYTPFL